MLLLLHELFIGNIVKYCDVYKLWVCDDKIYLFLELTGAKRKFSGKQWKSLLLCESAEFPSILVEGSAYRGGGGGEGKGG